MQAYATAYQAPTMGEALVRTFEDIGETATRIASKVAGWGRRMLSRKRKAPKAPKGYNGELGAAIGAAMGFLAYADPMPRTMTVARVY